uniref:Uncharacterized protein n=1 Tax=Strigamia maritima TaxID=126957 RepID=T1J2Y1_STRMM
YTRCIKQCQEKALANESFLQCIGTEFNSKAPLILHATNEVSLHNSTNEVAPYKNPIALPSMVAMEKHHRAFTSRDPAMHLGMGLLEYFINLNSECHCTSLIIELFVNRTARILQLRRVDEYVERCRNEKAHFGEIIIIIITQLKHSSKIKTSGPRQDGFPYRPELTYFSKCFPSSLFLRLPRQRSPQHPPPRQTPTTTTELSSALLWSESSSSEWWVSSWSLSQPASQHRPR